jgi:hypothetical protein
VSIFEPSIANMTGPVPVECPACGARSTFEDFSDAEKDYLIRSTVHHQLLNEYRLLVAMKAITDRFPNTQDPSLKHHLNELESDSTDEAAVAKSFRARLELLESFGEWGFLLEARFPFVRDKAAETREELLSFLVKCRTCLEQYLILPEEYYDTIG